MLGHLLESAPFFKMGTCGRYGKDMDVAHFAMFRLSEFRGDESGLSRRGIIQGFSSLLLSTTSVTVSIIQDARWSRLPLSLQQL